jgi:hypothetical protein
VSVLGHSRAFIPGWLSFLVGQSHGDSKTGARQWSVVAVHALHLAGNWFCVYIKHGPINCFAVTSVYIMKWHFVWKYVCTVWASAVRTSALCHCIHCPVKEGELLQRGWCRRDISI